MDGARPHRRAVVAPRQESSGRTDERQPHDEWERSDGRALLAEKEVRGKGWQPLYVKSVPRPVWDAEAVRHVIGGPLVARHRCRGRPGEVVVQHLSQSTIVG